MCDHNQGVAKRIDLESISKDIADLMEQLKSEVEGNIRVSDVKRVEQKLKKILED